MATGVPACAAPHGTRTVRDRAPTAWSVPVLFVDRGHGSADRRGRLSPRTILARGGFSVATGVPACAAPRGRRRAPSRVPTARPARGAVIPHAPVRGTQAGTPVATNSARGFRPTGRRPTLTRDGPPNAAADARAAPARAPRPVAGPRGVRGPHAAGGGRHGDARLRRGGLRHQQRVDGPGAVRVPQAGRVPHLRPQLRPRRRVRPRPRRRDERQTRTATTGSPPSARSPWRRARTAGSRTSTSPPPRTRRATSCWSSNTPSPGGRRGRWEVVVFRHPDDARQAYVKRVVGLPGRASAGLRRRRLGRRRPLPQGAGRLPGRPHPRVRPEPAARRRGAPVGRRRVGAGRAAGRRGRRPSPAGPSGSRPPRRSPRRTGRPPAGKTPRPKTSGESCGTGTGRRRAGGT